VFSGSTAHGAPCAGAPFGEDGIHRTVAAREGKRTISPRCGSVKCHVVVTIIDRIASMILSC
jgi:hypothetical protein